jgi:glycosyltransferase involved in cell wall biosynthesis
MNYVGPVAKGPVISVLVCTRDRPTDAKRAVRSLLASRDVDLEVVVVDQSEGHDTQCRLAALDDPRVRIVRTTGGGKPSAMNEGLRRARSSVVVVTDDDCEAPPDWVAGMTAALQARPDVALVFSNVIAAPHDRQLGYVPTYERRRDRMVRSVWATCTGRGLGAAMALRRDVVLALGGFDESIGPGARFGSGDDWDLELRLLLKGWHVYERADLCVRHYGFRTYAEGRDHSRRNWYGMGAVCAKPLRAGHPAALGLALWQLAANAGRPAAVDILHLHRPHGLGRIPAFSRGFLRGLTTSIDRTTLTYRTPARWLE